MRRISYLVVMAFVLAIFAQAVYAAQTTTTKKTTKTTTTKKATPAKHGKGPAQVVKVTEKEYSITLNPTTVKPGKVTFMIKNEGKMVHQFEVKGNGVDKKTPDIAEGKTRQLTVDLTKAGTYDVYCPLDGHKAKGMNATLTVK